MQLKRVSRKTPSAYLFPARRRFGGDLYTMVSSFMPLFAGRIDHGHAVRFAESPERVAELVGDEAGGNIGRSAGAEADHQPNRPCRIDLLGIGGGLPVDIWSRFMKVAHQGVAVAALPGLSAAPSFASALPSIAPPGAPADGPLGNQPGGPFGAQAIRPQAIDRGLDGWFLDRLFGRR